jgi:hypothetical protein
MSLFRKKSPIEKLTKKHKSLLEEAYKLSTINRKKSDELMYEADLIAKEIEILKIKN